MLVAGLPMSARGAGRLVLELDRLGHADLAQRIDFALDCDRVELQLDPEDQCVVLLVLEGMRRSERWRWLANGHFLRVVRN